MFACIYLVICLQTYNSILQISSLQKKNSTNFIRPNIRLKTLTHFISSNIILNIYIYIYIYYYNIFYCSNQNINTD